jgi:hypothetical protein
MCLADVGGLEENVYPLGLFPTLVACRTGTLSRSAGITFTLYAIKCAERFESSNTHFPSLIVPFLKNVQQRSLLNNKLIYVTPQDGDCAI